MRKSHLNLPTLFAAIALAFGAQDALIPFGANSAPIAFAQENEPELELDQNEPGAPLVLSATAEEDEQTVEQENQQAETLPEGAIKKTTEAPAEQAPASKQEDEFIDEEEMARLSNEPLFKDFAAAVEEYAPLPDSVDLGAINAPGAEMLLNGAQTNDAKIAPLKTPGALDRALGEALNEDLAILDVNLDSLNLLPSHRATLEEIDREISRLWPLWIDAEINRNVVGRRERDWRQNDPNRFAPDPGARIDAPANDWALAIDEPFFFRVVDPLTGETYFTKAGDFEQLDETGNVALIRDERQYFLEVEPGRVVPTGRARRVRILKSGKVQGVDAADKLITDVHLAQIPIYSFANPLRLNSRDGVFFTPTPFSGAPTRVELPDRSPIGIAQRALTLSNGRPDELFARISILCKSKKRLLEILSQPRLNADAPKAASNSLGLKDDAPESNASQNNEVAPDSDQESFELQIDNPDDDYDAGASATMRPPFLLPDVN